LKSKFKMMKRRKNLKKWVFMNTLSPKEHPRK